MTAGISNIQFGSPFTHIIASQDIGEHCINPDLFIGLPFALPQTPEGAAWLEELDFVDPYTARLADVQDLAASAPSDSARNWINGLIAARERVESFCR